MRNAMKKIVIFALVLTMILGTVGCGGKNKNEKTIDKNTIFKEEAFSLPFPENTNINSVSVSKDTIYFVGYTYDSVSYNTTYFIATCNIDGSNYQQKNFDPPTENSGMYVEGVYATSNGEAYLSYTEYFSDDSDPENYVWEEHYYIAKIDSQGNITSKIDAASEYGVSYISSFKVLKDDTIVFYANDSIYHVDGEGKIIAKKEVTAGTYINSFFLLKDGTFCVSYWGDDGMDKIKKVNADTLEFGEDIEVPFTMWNYSIMDGNDKYDILLRSSGSICGFNFGDSEPKELFNMINSDVNTSYFNSFAQVSDDCFVGTYNDYDYTTEQNNTTVAKYTKIDPSEYVEKTILTLGCIYLDSSIRSHVVNFNKKSDKYRITIKDYSVYETEDDYNAGYNRLNSDIASGQSPDIIIANDSSMITNYASKGLFVDLHKYLDNDSEINKADIWPNLIAACETDGKLYELVPSFNVQTLVGRKALLGDRTGWTMDEMLAFQDTLPEGTTLLESMSREGFLSQILYSQGKDYVDMGKATCTFDSPEFKALLSYCATLPKQDDLDITYDEGYYGEYSTQWRTGKVAIYNWYCSDASSYQELIKGYFGEDITIVGYPTTDGSNGSLLSFYSSLGISSKCKNQDGAWEFVKSFWSNDYQSSQRWGIPASMAQFREKAMETTKRPSWTLPDGTVEYYDNTFWTGTGEIVMDPLTEAEVDEFIAFIASVTKKAGGVDEEIGKIINDETESFFNGQKSVDDVATIIQNRVSTYIKEKQ